MHLPNQIGVFIYVVCFFEPPFCPINNPYVLLLGNITALHFTEESARKAFILLAPAELLNPPNKEFRFCRQTMQGFIQGTTETMERIFQIHFHVQNLLFVKASAL